MIWGRFNEGQYTNQLQEKFGLNQFRKSQWKVIKKILQGKKVLFIEKTGYGKSLCYQFPATLLSGITIVISPLISLMRDQVNSLKHSNISANQIHSGMSKSEISSILESAINNDLKLLYIAPERLENELWGSILDRLNISLFVIDEAHCISEWGHDFRPSYLRIIYTIRRYMKNIPILATTATVNSRVIKDIRSQIGRFYRIKGSLERSSFQISIIQVQNEYSKLAFIKENIGSFKGTGIIFCRTRSETLIYSEFIRLMGIQTSAYHGKLDNLRRSEIEKSFMENKYKVICSTMALGMGVNKNDIRFIIHTYVPESLLKYYQEIGRAGRDDSSANLILLYNPQEINYNKRKLLSQKANKKDFLHVFEILKNNRYDINKLMIKTGLSRGKLNQILLQFEKKKWIKFEKDSGKTYYKGQKNPFYISLRNYQKWFLYKEKELREVEKYCSTQECLMKFIRNALGDYSKDHCLKCNRCIRKNIYYVPQDESIQFAFQFMENYNPEIIINKFSLGSKNNLTNGVACSYYGKSDIGKIIRYSKYHKGGEYPEYLINRMIKVYQNYFHESTFDYLIPIPSSSDLLTNLVKALSNKLNIPVHQGLKSQNKGIQQKDIKNPLLKKINIMNKFNFIDPDSIINKNILLIDDICDSTETIKEAANVLFSYGANKISPLVIAKTMSIDE